jgi:hypothetical protein
MGFFADLDVFGVGAHLAGEGFALRQSKKDAFFEAVFLD